MSSMVSVGKTSQTEFHHAVRVQQAITAAVEKRVLLWMAKRVPESISPDHLTALGFAAQFLAGLSYGWASWNKQALWLASLFIALNWFGDSLDGTLARYRARLRPRYGFYVDHMADTFGAVFLMSGLALSGYLHWQIAVGMLIAFLVLSVESYLTTYTIGRFTMSHSLFGPTEIRILLIIGNIALIYHPNAHLLGHEILLFDVGGAIAIAGMAVMAVIATLRHTVALYCEERLQ